MPQPYPISSEALEMLAACRRDTDQAPPDARRASLALIAHIEHAAAIANSGQTAQAAALLRDALADTADLRLLFLGFQFFFRTGDVEQAESLTRRRVAAAEALGPAAHADLARALGNLALVLCTRSRLDEAETCAHRAIAIDRSIRDDLALSRDLGNLAMIFETRATPADLDRAEALYHQALDLAQRLGAQDLAATKLANLGDIALSRARRDQAVTLWTRAADLFNALGNHRYHQDMLAKIAAHAPNAP